MQREDSWWGHVREKKAVREEGQRTVLPHAEHQQERLAVVAEGRPCGYHWSWMWIGSTGIHLLHRQVSKPVLRTMARLRSKLCLQGWQITGRGKLESGLGDGNLDTVRQSAVANQLRG